MSGSAHSVSSFLNANMQIKFEKQQSVRGNLFQRVKVPLQASWISLLASGKVDAGDQNTEGNRTANFGTNEQEFFYHQ